jgi:hypothetical protein
MTRVAMVYHRPAGAARLDLTPQLASWERAEHPSQVKLARFLAHVVTVAGPMLAGVNGPIVAELTVGLGDEFSLIAGGHDLDN